MTHLISQHVNNYLATFIENPEEGFETAYEYVQNKNKEESKNILIYFDKLLNQFLNISERNLNYFHIHFEGISSDVINLLAEFIVIKFFFQNLYADKGNDSNSFLEKEINRINKKVITEIKLPEGATSTNKLGRKFFEEKTLLRQKLRIVKSFYDLNNSASLQPKTLLNSNKREMDFLLNLFKGNNFAIPIDSTVNDKSYVLINHDKTRDQIDELKESENRNLLELIENVIIFNCEQKQIHRQFNYKELHDWNNDGCNFRNLILISFNCSNYMFHKLKSSLSRAQSRFQLLTNGNNHETYSIIPSEVNYLLDINIAQKTIVRFLGESESSFWEDFKEKTVFYEGLYELISLKMMNIYSLVLNDTLKKMVLDDIFSFIEEPKIISNETWEDIKELSKETIDDFRNTLSDALDWIIASDWKDYLRKQISETATIVLHYSLCENEHFIREFRRILNLTGRNKIDSWDEISANSTNKIVILDYRDFGQYPFKIYPNIFKNKFKQSSRVDALFLRHFFENRYKWAQFKYNKEEIKLLNHPIRDSFFGWKNLYKENLQLKPERKDYINFEKESTYTRDSATIEVKYLFKNKSRSYHPADLFVILTFENNQLSVSRLDDLCEKYENEKEMLIKIQLIEELYSEYNPFEIIANVDREKSELMIIRDRFNIDAEESEGRLWKIILKRKSFEKGIDTIYGEVDSLMKKNNTYLVSQNTFENSWINTDSNTLIPREKKVFKLLCEYLGLPSTYFRIMRRLKNVEIQATRKNNEHMNNLLSDLINDGCFYDNANVFKILTENKEKYLDDHDIEELGIGKEQMIEDLEAFIDLLVPNMHLLFVEKINMNALCPPLQMGLEL
jgi:hypothetical protein